MACKCAGKGDVRPVGSRKRRQAAPDLAGRMRLAGRDYAAGRCYTRACSHGARDKRGGIVQEERRMSGAGRATRQEASGNVVQVQSRGGQRSKRERSSRRACVGEGRACCWQWLRVSLQWRGSRLPIMRLAACRARDLRISYGYSMLVAQRVGALQWLSWETRFVGNRYTEIFAITIVMRLPEPARSCRGVVRTCILPVLRSSSTAPGRDACSRRELHITEV